MKKQLLSLSLLATLCLPTLATAQTAPAQSLRDTILALDTALFDAFNACELDTFKQYLAEDIEFYQDNDKVTVTRAQLEPSFNDRCDANNPVKLRRVLVKESVEIHPILGFGAVQLGAHQFWVMKKGEADQLGSTPKFVHLWRNNNGTWQITRVISYGH